MTALRRLLAGISLALWFAKELVKSSLLVAREALRPQPRLDPAIFHLPILARSDAEIFLLANMISLTPGTLTLDVAPDRSFLVIHSVFAGDPEALIAELQSGMEARILKVMRR